MKKILLLILVVFGVGNALGQVLGRYSAGSTTASGVVSNITFGSLARGAGVDSQTASGYYVSNNWDNTTRAAARSANEFHGFSLQSNSTYQATYTSFKFTAYRTAAGPTVVGAGYSIDGGSTWTDSPDYSVTNASADYSFTWDFSDFTTTNQVIFRVYGWSASSTGNLRTKDFILEGTVTSTSCTAPAITTQPATSTPTACQGTAFPQLSVATSGTVTSYQWYYNTTASNSGGIAISGATSSTYTPLNDWGTATRYFYAVASGCSTTATSNVSGVHTPVTITATPNGTLAYSPNPACGAVSVTYTYGAGEPSTNTYYWQTTATGESTSLPVSSPYSMGSAGTVYVRAYNGSCWSTAINTVVVISTPPSISVHPNAVVAAVCSGGTFTALTVTAAGSSLSYQWYKSTDNSNATSGDDVTVGTNSASFTPSNSDLGTFYYYVIVSGASPCTPAKSNVSAARTVSAIPATPTGTFTPATSCGTAMVSYNFAAGESTDGNTYYWQTSETGTSTTSPVSSTYSVAATGNVHVRSYNGNCWSAVKTQNITISSVPNLTTQPNSTGVIIPATKTFSVAASGTVTYQWQLSTDGGSNWNDISGANSASYVTPATSEGMSGYQYKCIVTNSCGSTTSNVGTLTLTNSQPTNATAFQGCFTDNSVRLSWLAPASGTTPTGYVVFAIQGGTAPSGTKNTANTYTANLDFATATSATPASLGKVVYKGNNLSALITGLVENVTYSFAVFPYVGENLTNWASGSAGSRITAGIAQGDVTNLAGTSGTNKVTLNWSNSLPTACWDQLIIVANQGAVVFTPTGDGTNYAAAANDSYSTANQVVYSTTTGVASKTITGLTNGSEYCFKIFLRRGTEWTSGTSACATPSLIYCAAPVAGTMDYQTSVTNVTLNTLNNSSPTKTAGYVNNTALTPTNLNKGESYNLSVSVNTAGNWEIYSRAWIDWNKDGDFNDSGEEFDLGYATNTTNGITNGSPLSIMVPTTALVGTTRMRVSAKFLEYATPCDSGYDGEIEDYTINIVQVPGAEIYVKGNSQNIVSGSTTTSSLNQTVFAIQPIGTTSAAKDYIVGNVGLSNLILNGTPVISLTGANSGDFAVTQNPATTIASETFSTFSITFTPSGPGTRTAVVSIANNDSTGGENPFTFTIQGTGKSPEIDVQGNGISIVSGTTAASTTNDTHFGTVQITGGLVAKTFSILNTGSDVLTLSNIQLSGSSDFTITANPATSVAIDGSTTFTVSFNPSLTGEKNAIVVITNNDLNESLYTFAIQGFAADYIECGFGGEEVIVQQKFEGVGNPTPTWDYTNVEGSVTGGTAYGGTNSLVSKFIDTGSFQVANKTATLTLNPFNTADLSDVNLSFKLAAFSGTTGNGMETGDYVRVEVSTDGTNWSREIQISGSSDANSRWSYTTGTATATKSYAGIMSNPFQIYQPTGTGTSTANGYGTVSLTNLPKVENLRIRITLLTNDNNEIWAIDDVVLKGKRRAVKTWNGSNWLNASATISTAPTATEIAIINSNYSTASGNLLGCKCQVNPTFTLTVASDTYVVIQNDVKNDGAIIIENNGSLVQKNDFAENTGQITYKRITPEITRYDYIYWSSPVAGFSLHDVSPNTLSDKYFSWDKVAQDWHLETDGDVTMQKGAGYIARGSQSFTTGFTADQRINATFEGIPNNGEVKLDGVDAGQANFLGNPYPSAIDARLFLDPVVNPHLEGTIYLWTHATEPARNPITGHYNYTEDDYIVYNLSGGTVSSPNGEELNHHIAAGQSFFADGASQGPIVFNNSMRATGNNGQFLRNQNTQHAESGSEKNRIWLNLENAQTGFSQTMVGYIENATNSYDRFYDGKVFGGTSVSLYSLNDNADLTIQARALPFDTNDKVNLGYRATLAGAHTITIDHVDGLFTGDQNIYLEDKVLHVIHNLKNSAYTFTTAVGTFNNRFVLRYTSESLGNPDFDAIKNAVIVSVKNKAITVNSSLENIKGITVYDLLGRVIYDNKKVNAKDFTIQEANAAQQALVVKIVLDNGMETSKKIILN